MAHVFRYHKKTSEKQLLVSDIYKQMGEHLTDDTFAMLGITWTDLYPSESLNFVLGELLKLYIMNYVYPQPFNPPMWANELLMAHTICSYTVPTYRYW